MGSNSESKLLYLDNDDALSPRLVGVKISYLYMILMYKSVNIYTN